MMNPNLMNPEIVVRMAQERQLEMRRQVTGLPAAELEGEYIKPFVRQVREQKRRSSPLSALFAWLFARAARQG